MTPLELPLEAVVEELERSLPALLGATIRPRLVRARYCDALRDMGVLVPLTEELAPLFGALDGEGWGRLAMYVEALDGEDIYAQVSRAAQLDADPLRLSAVAFPGFAASTDLHTLDLLSRSAHRREEIARAWLLRLGIGIQGESTEESVERLDRLDYARLLDDVERVKASAADRAGFVRELQEKAERAMNPRGKW